MQNINETVDECTLAVEAHVICDLRARRNFRELIVARLDVDGDGRTDQTWRCEHAVLQTVEFQVHGRVVKRDTCDSIASAQPRDARGFT